MEKFIKVGILVPIIDLFLMWLELANLSPNWAEPILPSKTGEIVND